MIVSGTVEGLAAFRQRIADMTERAANLEPALLRAGSVVLRAAQKRIDAGGPGWPANLSGTPLLRRPDGGTLYRSLTIGASDNIAEVGSSSIRVGTNVFYAAWNQEGTGIYGARGSRIYPTSAQALAFTLAGPLGLGSKKGRAASSKVIVRSIKGDPARPFLIIDQPTAQAAAAVFRDYLIGGAAPGGD